MQTVNSAGFMNAAASRTRVHTKTMREFVNAGQMEERGAAGRDDVGYANGLSLSCDCCDSGQFICYICWFWVQIACV